MSQNDSLSLNTRRHQLSYYGPAHFATDCNSLLYSLTSSFLSGLSLSNHTILVSITPSFHHTLTLITHFYYYYLDLYSTLPRRAQSSLQ